MAVPAAPATLRQRYRRWPVAPGTCGQKPASLSHLPTVPGPLEATAPLDGGYLRGICGPERCLPTAGDGRALAHLETGAAAVRVCATVVSGSGGVRKSVGSTMLLRKQRGQTAGFGCDTVTFFVVKASKGSFRRSGPWSHQSPSWPARRSALTGGVVLVMRWQVAPGTCDQCQLPFLPCPPPRT